MSTVHKPATAGKKSDPSTATPPTFLEKFPEAGDSESNLVELDAKAPGTERAPLPQSGRKHDKRCEDD